MPVALIPAIVAAAGAVYSGYESNKSAQEQRDSQKNALKQQQALAATQTGTPVALPHTTSNYPDIASQIETAIPGIQASGLGGLSPSYVASQAATQTGNPNFSDLATQILNQSMGGH